MRVSIITATYNSAKTLCDTLNSIEAQSFSDYEVIVQDGGSGDETIGIASDYATRNPGKFLIFQERDNGIYDAMNRGIAHATGDVIGILNSDDLYYDTSVLSDIVSVMQSDSVDCIYGDLVFVKEDDTTSVQRTWKGSQYVNGGFLKGWHPAHPTFYCKREWFEKLGGFDLDFAVSADFELMLRFIEKAGISNKYIPRNFVRMRLGGESTGSIKNIIKGNKNIIKAFRKNGFKVNPCVYLVRRLAPKAWNMLKSKVLGAKV